MKKEATLKVKFRSKEFKKIKKIMKMLKVESPRPAKISIDGFTTLMNAFENQTPLMKEINKRFSFTFPVFIDELDDIENLYNLSHILLVKEDVTDEELENCDKEITKIIKNNTLVRVVKEIAKAIGVTYIVTFSIENEKSDRLYVRLKETKKGNVSLSGSVI